MIYVFRTSVTNSSQVKKLRPYINDIISSEAWNFDLTDRDKILRVESQKDCVSEIEDLLTSHSFICEELE